MKTGIKAKGRAGAVLIWATGLGLFMAFFGTGCHLVRKASEIPGQAVRAVTPGAKTEVGVDPVEVQEKMLRFSDEFSARMIIGLERLSRSTNTFDPAAALRWKIMIRSETCAIASGPNAIANLLDMIVFVSVTRGALEDYWEPKVFGEAAHPMVESCRNAETNIWQIAATVLKPDQQSELRSGIEEWRRQNPRPEDILTARALGMGMQVAQATRTDTSKPGSVFNLLMIDPLAGLDPATREIAQARLFAERALYVTQKMPQLLRWQTELLSLDAMQGPAVQQLVTNVTLLTASVERFSRVAEQVPAKISTEREEILKGLQSQEKQLTPLVSEVRQALTAGSQMSTSLNTTLITFDALMKRFGVGETNNASPPDTNSTPFRIQDYGQTAVQLEAAARQLTDLVRALDQTIDSTNLSRLSAQVSPVVQQAQTGGKEVIDYAFWKAILLMAAALVAALIYRFLANRLPVARSKSLTP